MRVRIGAMPCASASPGVVIPLAKVPARYGFSRSCEGTFGQRLERWLICHDYMLVLFQTEGGDYLLLKVPRSLWPWLRWGQMVGFAKSFIGGCPCYTMLVEDPNTTEVIQETRWNFWRELGTSSAHSATSDEQDVALPISVDPSVFSRIFAAGMAIFGVFGGWAQGFQKWFFFLILWNLCQGVGSRSIDDTHEIITAQLNHESKEFAETAMFEPGIRSNGPNQCGNFCDVRGDLFRRPLPFSP